MRLPRKAAWRYAQALLDLAEAAGTTEAVRADFTALQGWLRGSPALAAFLPNYLMGRAARDRTLRGLFGERLQPLTLRLVLVLEQKKRPAVLPDVAQCFLERYDRLRGIARGRLVSAFPLDAAAVAAITARAQARAEGSLALGLELNPDLLGGFQIWAEDRLYDLSLAARLRRAADVMSNG